MLATDCQNLGRLNRKLFQVLSTAILPPSTDSRRVVVSYKWKHVHEVLGYCLVELAQKNVWLGDRPNMIIAVDWDVKNQTKQTRKELRITTINSGREVIFFYAPKGTLGGI